jgi:spermidine synthase
MAGLSDTKTSEEAETPGRGSFWLWVLPNFTVFVSSGCIMVVELVAGRLIARYVGSSLYTWTSVIGIVLAGIAAGNYVGGRLADRYRPSDALASLFLVASATCLLIPMLNVRAGNWMMLRDQEWVLRIFGHVFLVFFLPSTLLGTIGPVAAKMALDLGRETGRTVGSVYSWGALGSIVGTFLTGYYLIARMGTVAVLLSVAAILLAMALLFGSRSVLPFLWAGVIGASFLAMAGPFEQARVAGERLGLRPSHGNWVHFHKETQYSTISVEDEDDMPGVRSMTLDFLIHAYVNMNDPEELVYEYEQIYAAVTRAAAQGRPAGRRLRALSLGGGGFVFPRWLLRQWPDSYLEVAEIDPEVTRAAHESFGLSIETPIRVFNLDARNHVEDVLRQVEGGAPGREFDFVYADAFNHYSPPFHLTTREFNDKLRRLMAPDGVLLANVIDIYRSGRFIGAMINTLEASFPHVYAISSSPAGPSDDDGRDTFIIVASGRPLDLGDLVTGIGAGMALDPEQLATLRRRSEGFVLTDDFAPVDNMLAPVIRMADKQ